jgi:hypothetical protein
MKALKSQLAKDVLADPRAKDQLRSYLARRTAAATTVTVAGEAGPETLIELRTEGRVLRLRPVAVPKAA